MTAYLDLTAWSNTRHRVTLLDRLQRHARAGITVPADMVIAVGLDCPRLIRTDAQRIAALAAATAVLRQQQRFPNLGLAHRGAKGGNR